MNTTWLTAAMLASSSLAMAQTPVPTPGQDTSPTSPTLSAQSRNGADITNGRFINPRFDQALVGAAVDASHTTAGGGISANYLGLTAGTVDCPTSTQSSTSMLCIRAGTGSTTRQPYTVNITLDSYAGSTGDPVALFAGVRVHNGGRQSWAFNTVTHMEPGALGGIGAEIDLNNWNCDAGANGLPGAAGCSSSPSPGLLITGASPYPAGTAISISGAGTASAQWHDGISMLGGSIIDRYSIYTNNLSQIDYEIRGGHQIGIDMVSAGFSQAAVRLAQGQSIAWVSATGVAGQLHSISSQPHALLVSSATGPVLAVDDTLGIVPIKGVTVPDGQKVCWSGGGCMTYQTSTSKFLFFTASHESAPVASISANGTMTLRGRLIQNGSP